MIPCPQEVHMLRITIDLLPFGAEDEQVVLSQFVIHNIGRDDTLAPGVYRYKVSKSLTDPAFIFTHKRSDGLFVCLEQALRAVGIAGLDKL